MKENKFYSWLARFNKDWPYKLDKLRMKLGLLKEQDWSELDKVFIVSTGRTGTKFFAHFLDEFSNVYGLHEPEPDFLELAINYARNKVEKIEAIRRIEKNRRALCRSVKRQRLEKYVESNNRFFSLLEPLDKIFNGNLKVIHIIRDGRDYVRSGMSRNWYNDKDEFAKKDLRLKATYFPEDNYYNQWHQMSRFEKICWRWQKKDGFIYQNIDKIDNTIRVKFEDIFKTDDYKSVFTIAEYIGLPQNETERMIDKMMGKEVNSTKEYAISKWTEWDDERIDKFDEIAGEHMEKYYDY